MKKTSVDPKILERFWKKVKIIEDETSCWEWQGCLYEGYGKFFYSRGYDRAHRVAYLFEIGPIPKGNLIMHLCDNRRCCRPDHLRAGNVKDNVLDMKKKGRQARGENKWTAKLTADQIVEIREACAAGEKHDQLAKKYGITGTNVSSIARGASWKHVGGPRTQRRRTAKITPISS